MVLGVWISSKVISKTTAFRRQSTASSLTTTNGPLHQQSQATQRFGGTGFGARTIHP
jgi:hypothetical protein